MIFKYAKDKQVSQNIDSVSVKPLILFEQLEPRILLSVDSLLNIAPDPLQDTILDNTHQVAQYAELLDTQEQVEEQINLEPAPSDTSNSDVYPPIFTLFVDDDKTNDESVDADLSVDNIGSAQTGDVLAVLSNDSDGDIESKVDTTQDDGPQVYVSNAEISVEENTSIEIRGPPHNSETSLDNTVSSCLESERPEADLIILDEYAAEVQPDGTLNLPGMHLVDPTVDYFDGQIVYLDFDGAQDVTYNGPVVVEGINIPEFSAESAGLAGQEQEIISQILSALEQKFDGTRVQFTTSVPDPGISYSTIFFGGDGAEFREYGFFVGLAEKIDVGNQDPNDNAFVFSENIVSGYTDLGILVTHLADLIAHETAHLLGYAHEVDSEIDGSLHAVADTGTLYKYEWTPNHTIPDNGGWDGRVIWSTDLSGAPAGATITSIDVEYWINHTWISDLNVWLTTERGGTWYDKQLWNREGGDADDIYEKETGLSNWNGLSPNGTWYLMAADYAPGDEGEIDAWKIWVHWEALPDLIVSGGPLVSDNTVYPGQSITVDWTAKNNGNGSCGSSQQGVMWSTNSTISRSDTLLDREYLGPLSAGQSTPEAHTITIPSNATIGSTYYIGIYEDYDLGIAESNESNNASSGAPVTIIGPDLIAYSITVSDTTVDRGQSITVYWTAKNQGDGDCGDSQQGVMWSIDNTITKSDDLLEKEYLGPMNAGETSPEAHTITIPSNANYGQIYYIGIFADYDEQRAESNESNNGNGTPVAVTINDNRPDVVVTDILMDELLSLPNVVSGQDVRLDFDVLNQGGSTTIPDVHMRWWWGTSEVAMTNFIADGSLGSINGLSPGESERETDASWVIPQLATGTYWLTAKIDWDDRVDESLEGNNVRSESFTVVEPFEPSFQDAWITNKVDVDGDGYASEFLIEFDVNSNIAGDYYVKVWEYDLGLPDDYLLTSDTFPVDGTTIDYRSVHINCSDFPGADFLSRGEAEFRLDLYDAATDTIVETWLPGDDPDLGNVDVELSSEDLMLQWEDESGQPLTAELTFWDTVQLAVYANDMTGVTINLEVYEDDVVFDDLIDDTLSVTIGVGEVGRTSWIVPWQQDGYDVLHNDFEPEYFFRAPDYNSDDSLTLDVEPFLDPDAYPEAVGIGHDRFFALAPWQLVSGDAIPLVLGYVGSAWDLTNPSLDYVEVRIGDSDILVDLWSSPVGGTNLGGDLPEESREILGDSMLPLAGRGWWYTMGYIQASNYLDQLTDGTGSLEIDVVFRCEGMDELFSRNQSVMVEVVPGLPEWDYWYAGDTHWHSDLTNSMNDDAFTIISSLAELLSSELVALLQEGAVFGEYGTPLAIGSVLAPAVGLDWVTITDHSYELDGSNDDAGGPEPDAWRDLYDFSDTGLVVSTVYDYGWGNLEDSPAFDSFLFLKGEEVSVDANQTGIDAISRQYHMLVYDFDSGDVLIAGPGYIDWERSLEMRDLGLATDAFVGDIMDDVVNDGLFTYAAHPMLTTPPYGEAWGDPATNEISVIMQALDFVDSGSQPVFRGFEFWNGQGDSGRDSSLSLWEDVLAYLMGPSDDSAHLYNWYLSGGSDEHLNALGGLEGVLGILGAPNESYVGDVRTVIYAPSLSDPNVLDALYYGKSFVTDGPWFAMGVDANSDGDFMDFGIDTMLGEQLVLQYPSEGNLLFDWPNQTDTVWGDVGLADIDLIHYYSNGIQDPNDGSGFYNIANASQYFNLSERTFNAYQLWENQGTQTGWQAYRAELTLGDYKAYTNPIWLYFTLDTTVPVVQAWSLSEDTGTNSTDKLTNDTTPQLVFTFSETVFGEDSDVIILDPDSNPVVPGSIAGWGSNTVVIAFSTSLVLDGEYTVTLNGTSTIEDEAGNPLNGGVDEVVSFYLDTTAPVVTVDTLLTNDKTPKLTGTVDDPDAAVEVTVADSSYFAVNYSDGTLLNLGPEELIQANGVDIDVPGYSVPSFVDWNNDKLNDLVIGEGGGGIGDGKIRVYLNVGTESNPQFSDYFYAQSNGSDLTCPSAGCMGCFPRVVYWDADDRKDLLVGQANGTVKIFLNIGTDENPTFDGGTSLQVGQAGSKMNIDVGIRPTPSFVDWNNDDKRDLIVGAYYYARIHIFINEGTDTDPDFHAETFAQEDASNLVVPPSHSSPEVLDLDGDGRKDLLTGNKNGELLFYSNVGTDEAPRFSGYSLVKSNGVPISLPGLPRSRPFVCYWTGEGHFGPADPYPDVLIGAGGGKVHLFRA